VNALFFYHPYRYVNHPNFYGVIQNDQNVYLERNNGGKCQQIFNAILDAIKGEAAAIDFYTRLVQLAPNKKHREDILHALEDEKIHLKEFTKLYTDLTGKKPIYQVKKTTFQSYEEGLRKAYEDELEAYEDYRDSYLLTQNPPVRDVFLRAFTDEIEHATRFGFLILGLY
jgi:rubrerythrin